MTDHDRELDEPIASLVRGAAPTRFADGFAARVLARVHARRESSLVHALERQFMRIVPLAAAATVLLAAYNWWGAHETAASALDAALDLPRVTLSSAYAPATLYGVANTLTETSAP
jgi:hypothetical protein